MGFSMFYTYILHSQSADRFYTGYTSYTPQNRLHLHNQGSTPSTKSGIPWEIQFCKSFDTKTEAIKFENFIKRQKSKVFIQKLIDSDENEYRE
ncbi:GIY-YIG nuclease family protein [Rhodohalobacter sp. 614A]|uniref:GIY-YIG nuclease family protein n=1 Tax=Rhodohalobacter sp. 614A TaxID=2908649 RepID=UPI00351CFDB7